MRTPYPIIVLLGAVAAAAAASSPSSVWIRRPFAAFASTAEASGKAVSSEVTENSKASVLSLARQINADSKTGVFIADPNDKADLKRAVADLEAVCGTPSERWRQLMIGDWTLLCTLSSPAGASKNENKAPKLPFKLPDIPLQDKITKSVEVTQRIRSVEDEDGKGVSGSNTRSAANTINRVDNIIEYTPFANTLGDILGENTPFDALKDLKVNPFEVSKSKVSLIHSADVQSISPVLRTKIALKSIVLTVAGTSQYLEPDGADLLGLNVPLGEFTNSGSFDTTYVDENLRVSRGNIGFVDVLRVFVRKGIDAETDEITENVEVSRSETKPSEIEKKIDEVAGAVADAVETVQKVSEDLRDTIETDVEYVRESVDEVVDAVRDVSEDVQGVVEDDMKEIRSAAQGVADAVVGKEVREAVEDTIEENLDNIQKAVDSVRGETKASEKNEEEEGDSSPESAEGKRDDDKSGKK